MKCKHADSGCNYPEGECGGQCVKTEHDKAVALELAKRHTQSIVRVSNDGEPLSGTVLLTFEGLAAMLAERDKQHREELAQRSVVMPEEMVPGGWDEPICLASKVREAIASLEARVRELEMAITEAKAQAEKYPWASGAFLSILDAAMNKESGK